MNEMIIIMVAIFTLIIVVMYVMMRNLTKPKKNVVLGVTLPYEARSEAEVTYIGDKYKKWLTLILVFTLIPGGGVFIPELLSMKFTYMMSWFMVALALQYIPYTIYHRKLKRLKEEKGWRKESAASTLVDIKVAAEDEKKPKLLWFLLPLAVSLLPLPLMVFDINSEINMSPMILVNFVIILIFILSDRLIYRQKGEIAGANSALNAALTQMRKRYWHKCWLILCWITSAVNIFIYLFRDMLWAVTVTFFIYSFIALIVSLGAELRVRKMQAELSKESGQDVYLDEDDYWINGMFYCNPNDRHFLKNERVGMGMTVNFGRWPGKVTAILSVLALMMLPLACVWMAAEELTPIALSVADGYVVSHHLREEYKIKLDDIESVELLDSVPESFRVMGTGLPGVSKGLFRVKGYDNVEVCYNPDKGPYVVIDAEEKTYIFGSDIEGETEAVYKQLVS